jgi:hypothetical protein
MHKGRDVNRVAAVECCAVLCCAVLCCAVLCCDVLCCAVRPCEVAMAAPLNINYAWVLPAQMGAACIKHRMKSSKVQPSINAMQVCSAPDVLR